MLKQVLLFVAVNFLTAICNVFAIAFKIIVFICVDLIIQCLLARRIFYCICIA